MAGEQFCGEDWLRLKRKYDTYDEEDLLRFCFSTAYIVALLHDTLGFAMDDGRYMSYAHCISASNLYFVLFPIQIRT